MLTPEPLKVQCNNCGAEGFTFDYQHPDLAVRCACCPVEHNHGESASATGIICRPVTIFGTAHLKAFDVSEVLDAMAEVTDPAVANVLFLVHRLAGAESASRRACPAGGARMDRAGR